MFNNGETHEISWFNSGGTASKEVENWFDFWALPTFGRLKCPRVHCLAGLNGSAELYRSNLRKAVEFLGPDVEAELSCSKIAVG